VDRLTTTVPAPGRPALGGNWEPALSGVDGERALTWALRLGDELRGLDAGDLGPSLAHGAAGLAVLFGTLSAVVGRAGYAEPAARYLSLAADRLTFDAPRRDSGLFVGLSGVAWAEALVARLQGEPPPPNDDIDELLGGVLAGPWAGPWDLAAGLVGIGVYALDRAATDPRLLDLVLARLADARAPADGWAASGARGELGMAHGIAGVVAFTALATRADAARPLLAEATGALLAGQGGDGRAVAGWCGGDLALAAALALAGPLLSHPLVPQALSAALGHAAAAHPSAVTGLGLCHGVAGVAHVLQRVAVGQHRRQAWVAAGDWGRALLDRLDGGERAAGPGLIDGAAGVVLSLLALATDVPPVWDRALLLS
jgi:lantibiotic modifying enzyme